MWALLTFPIFTHTLKSVQTELFTILVGLAMFLLHLFIPRTINDIQPQSNYTTVASILTFGLSSVIGYMFIVYPYLKNLIREKKFKEK